MRTVGKVNSPTAKKINRRLRRQTKVISFLLDPSSSVIRFSLGEEFANVDEDDDGTYQVSRLVCHSASLIVRLQGIPLSDIPNICQEQPNLVDMKDVRDPAHLFLIKVDQNETFSPPIDPRRLVFSRSNSIRTNQIENRSRTMRTERMSTNGICITSDYLVRNRTSP